MNHKPTKKPANYWTFEKVKTEALKYMTRNEFKINSITAYNKAIKNKWINEICFHMILKCKPANYWTYEKIKTEALKYDNKTDFMNSSNSAYYKAVKNNWINEICSHMIKKQIKRKRFLYVFEFNNKHAYIGLTCNIKNRKSTHLRLTNKKFKISSVSKYINETNQTPIFKLLKKNPVDEKKASLLEIYYIEKYRKNNWVLLNKIKGGGLGGNNLKWTKNNIQTEALKYNTRSEFQCKSRTAYNAARRYKILDEICSHMISKIKPMYYWSFNTCKKEALKYKTRNEYHLNSCASYDAAHRNNWLNKICLHMKQPNKNQYTNLIDL